MSKSIPELYGSLVFNDSEMKARLPKDVYKALTKNDQQRFPSGAGYRELCCSRNERMGRSNTVLPTSLTGSSR